MADDGGHPTNAGRPCSTDSAAYGELNEQCVPHLLASSGHPAWGDPVNYPWSTPSFLSYSTEGGIWASHIIDEQDAGNLPNPATVGTLTMNNDFGLAMLNGFKNKIVDDNLGDRIEIIGDELFDSTAPNVSNEVTTLGGTDADVAIIGTAGASCTQGMESVAQSSWEPTLKMIANTCTPALFEPIGEAGVGWVQAGGLKDLKDPLFSDDPLIIEAKEVFDDAGVDWQANANAGLSLQYAIPQLEALKGANLLPGGITRTNVIIAMRSIDFKNEAYYDGITYRMDGLNDVYPVEGAQLQKYELDADQGFATPVPVGDIIDLDGTTPICEWDGQSC